MSFYIIRRESNNDPDLKPKWLILVNFNAGQTTYQRNPAEYGAALGAIKHRSASLELSVGIARKLTKN